MQIVHYRRKRRRKKLSWPLHLLDTVLWLRNWPMNANEAVVVVVDVVVVVVVGGAKDCNQLTHTYTLTHTHTHSHTLSLSHTHTRYNRTCVTSFSMPLPANQNDGQRYEEKKESWWMMPCLCSLLFLLVSWWIIPKPRTNTRSFLPLPLSCCFSGDSLFTFVFFATQCNTTVCKSLVVLFCAENSFVWYVIQYCIQCQRNSATGCRGKSTVTTVRNPITNQNHPVPPLLLSVEASLLLGANCNAVLVCRMWFLLSLTSWTNTAFHECIYIMVSRDAPHFQNLFLCIEPR